MKSQAIKWVLRTRRYNPSCLQFPSTEYVLQIQYYPNKKNRRKGKTSVISRLWCLQKDMIINDLLKKPIIEHGKSIRSYLSLYLKGTKPFGTISTVEATSHFLVTILSQTFFFFLFLNHNLTGAAFVTKRSRLEIIRRKNQSYIFPSLP